MIRVCIEVVCVLFQCTEISNITFRALYVTITALYSVIMCTVHHIMFLVVLMLKLKAYSIPTQFRCWMLEELSNLTLPSPCWITLEVSSMPC